MGCQNRDPILDGVPIRGGGGVLCTVTQCSADCSGPILGGEGVMLWPNPDWDNNVAQYQVGMLCTETQSRAEYRGPLLGGDNIAAQF